MNLLLFHLQTLFILLLLPRRRLSQIPLIYCSLSMNYLSRLYLHFISKLCSAMHSLHTLCSSYWFTWFAPLTPSLPLGWEELPGGKGQVLPISMSQSYTLCISAAIRIMSAI